MFLKAHVFLIQAGQISNRGINTMKKRNPRIVKDGEVYIWIKG